MVEIYPISDQNRPQMHQFLAEHWGAPVIVSRGRVHHATDLPGYAAFVAGELKGLITYHIAGDACEIVSLDSTMERQGIATALIDKVKQVASQQRCKRVWLITTNDNTHAMRFYQRRGFSLSGVHLDAVAAARQLKPQIPLHGVDGIPIRHELEFELLLPTEID